jgi:hypothetical protein
MLQLESHTGGNSLSAAVALLLCVQWVISEAVMYGYNLESSPIHKGHT